jgi:anti-sigma factor RsiW
VAQHDEHLTTEQLSAFLDKQLAPQEQAAFDAHVSACQECQGKLADLRLTVALVRALPQEEVPRSFVLPSRLVPVAERPLHRRAGATPVTGQRRVRAHALQRTVRVISTLAAVLALIFIISGILPLMHSGGGAASTASYGSSAETKPSSNSTAMGHVNGTATTDRPQAAAGAETPTPSPTQAARVQSNTGSSPSTAPPPPLPPALDLGQPEGRLALGALLLVLGIIGLIITRRRRGAVY